MGRNRSKCPHRLKFGGVFKEMKRIGKWPSLRIFAELSGVDYSNLSKLINGDRSVTLGPKEKPTVLLGITKTLMRKFARSAIPNEDLLRIWLYDVCPNELVNDEGRKWVWDEALKMPAEMNFDWPVPEDAKEVEGALTFMGVLREVMEPATDAGLLAPKRVRSSFLKKLSWLLENEILDIDTLKDAVNMLMDYSGQVR